MKYLSKDTPRIDNTNNDSKQDITDYRIDKEKDYVYYDNIKVVLSELEVDYRDIYINLPIASSINKTLNEEEEKLITTVKYIKDVDFDKTSEYEENEEGVYSLTYREYEEYDYEEYISILVKDINYDVVNLNENVDVKAYIFDKKNNTIITENNLLEKYNVSLDTLKDKIKTKLNAEQQTVDGVALINVNETTSNLKYAIYINKIGKLEIGFIVNSTKQNYYDNITIE